MNNPNVKPGSTVLILGAGVSQPYGFPSGEGLVEEILNIRPETIVKRTHPKSFSTYDIQTFQELLEKSARRSVDRFLEHQSDYLEVGKHCIAYILLSKENEVALYSEKAKKQGGIYRYLYNNLLHINDPTQLRNTRLVVITYNYDRSFEWYFLNALRDGFEGQNTESNLRHIPIIHMHGDLGDFDLIPYGGGDFNRLSDSAKCISVVSEHTPSVQQKLEVAKENIRHAKSIVFLGFGYDEVNLSRLGIPEIFRLNEQLEDPVPELVIGTSLGFTDAEQRTHIRPLFEDVDVILEDMDCLSFLRQNVDRIDIDF